MLCEKCKKEIQLKIERYLYYVGTTEGALEFMKLDEEGKTDKNVMSGTTRIFNYLFDEYKR